MKVYCTAKCGNKTCEAHKYFKPQHGGNPTADFSDRCGDHKPVPNESHK